MKYAISLIILLFIIVLSCNTGKENLSIFSRDNLPVTKFTINTEKDTVLQTGNGALVKIPAGTIQNKNGTSVTLEIKEAYSMEQIIKAGLFTQSNGQPLSSGGMIYINAAAGQEVTFKQKIQVAIPADFIEDSMQLYKGEEQEDGSINWEQPLPLSENKQQQNIKRGEVLFKNNCANCHEIGVNRTGPNLAHFMKRFPFDEGGEEEGGSNEQYYIHHSQWNINNYHSEDNHYKTDSSRRFFHSNAAAIYKCNLHKYWLGHGPIFPIDSPQEYLSIFQYIQNESDRLDLPYPSHAYLKDCVDSCKIYLEKTAHLKELKNLTQQERDDLVKDNGEMTNIIDNINIPENNSQQQPSLSQQDFEEKVSPQNFEATYYQFSIETFGWYNIDILLQDLNNGVVESELFVRIVGEHRERINIFLIIPSVKVYGEGGPAAGDDSYAFFYKTGKIPLPQNTQAYILAVTEQNEKIAFALKEFTTNTSQEFKMALETSTKEKFDAVLSTFGRDNFNVTVNDLKNADSIRASDRKLKDIDQQLKEAEGLKPKNCDCDCGKSDTVTMSKPIADYYY